MRNIDLIGILLGAIGTACWGVCFWWMHRISVRQDTMLSELHAVATRIESLSQKEHDLISEVHPTVEQIKQSVESVALAVAADDSSTN